MNLKHGQTRGVSYMTAFLPIPLRLAGAHTHRLSGDWHINAQNLPTGRGGKPTKLRLALKAPPGYKVIVGDVGQMHARLTSWLSGSPLLQQFRDKEDPYNAMASNIFDRPINRKLQSDEIEGQIGKAGVLGLGFGAAARKFYSMVLRTVRASGGDLDALKKVWTLDLAEKAVRAYRRAERKTVDLWYKLDLILETSFCGKEAPIMLGPVEIGHGYVKGPSGLKMQYVVPEDFGGRDKILSICQASITRFTERLCSKISCNSSRSRSCRLRQFAWRNEDCALLCRIMMN